MPALLTDQTLLEPHAPLSWQRVLEPLDAFRKLERELRGKTPTTAQQHELQQLHDRLVAASENLLEPEALAVLEPDAIERCFAKSVYLLLRMGRFWVESPPPLDTAGSRTLPHYEVDYFARPERCRAIRRAVQAVTSLPAAEHGRLQAEVDEDARVAEEKQAIVTALRDRFGLWSTDADEDPDLAHDQAAHACFEALYPGSGIVAGEVRVIVSGMMLFFCIPYAGTELQTERFRRLNADQQQPTRDLLKRLQRFSQRQFAHFPVFGFLRGQDVGRELRYDLAERSGVPLPRVTEHLSCLTAIIPLAEIDKYVVHDIFGHGWQANLLRFDGLYAQLAEYADRLHLQTPCDDATETLRLGDCFAVEGRRVTLRVDRFRAFAARMVAARLPVAVTPVLAELLADVTEFKVLADADPSRAADASFLPSSSLLASFPAKLDLLIQDLDFYFKQATKALRLWAKQPRRYEATIEELIAAGGDAQQAAAAVERARQEYQQLAAEALSAAPQWRPHGDQLQVNLAARVALNFVGMHRETLHAYERIRELQLDRLPLRGFRDLLLIGASVFFVQDPRVNLWRIDEWLSLKIEPLCERLGSALQAAADQPDAGKET